MIDDICFVRLAGYRRRVDPETGAVTALEGAAAYVRVDQIAALHAREDGLTVVNLTSGSNVISTQTPDDIVGRMNDALTKARTLAGRRS